MHHATPSEKRATTLRPHSFFIVLSRVEQDHRPLYHIAQAEKPILRISLLYYIYTTCTTSDVL